VYHWVSGDGKMLVAVQKRHPAKFFTLCTLNLTLFLILFLFATVVIDGFVLGYWRPAFLRLPDSMGWTLMKVHMLKSLPMGIISGFIVSLYSAVISFYLLMD
jgi:tetrahydromethanopterin S-methyltransferase subunit D